MQSGERYAKKEKEKEKETKEEEQKPSTYTKNERLSTQNTYALGSKPKSLDCAPSVHCMQSLCSTAMK
jgi:hypothetical protein